jgi:3-dehydroquinate dehydratase
VGFNSFTGKKPMNRIAAVVIACLGVMTTFLFYLRIAERVPTASNSGEAEIIARLDRLEKSIAQLAAARAGAPSATDSATLATIAAPAAGGRAELDGERVAAARASAIRDGNDIVDRALGVGQWTVDDVRALVESTETLDGEAAAAIHARLAAAINSDRL